MGAVDVLRRIDRRAVPPLGDALHWLIRGPGRLPLLAGLVVGTLLLTAAVWTESRAPVGSAVPADVVQVGVPPGRSISGYVADSRRELTTLVAADGQAGRGPAVPVYALVTLAAYLAPDRLAPVVGGLAISAVYARVPLPYAQTEIVKIDAFRIPEDVRAGMDQVALRKDGEALDYRDLSAKLTGHEAAERRLRGSYDEEARVAEAEAEAYRQRCSCVYAVVVRAAPADLVTLTTRGEVRAVDPAPRVRRLDRAVFLPPLPEQSEPAGVHPVRPAAAGRARPAAALAASSTVPDALSSAEAVHNRPSAGYGRRCGLTRVSSVACQAGPVARGGREWRAPRRAGAGLRNQHHGGGRSWTVP